MRRDCQGTSKKGQGSPFCLKWWLYFPAVDNLLIRNFAPYEAAVQNRNKVEWRVWQILDITPSNKLKASGVCWTVRLWKQQEYRLQSACGMQTVHPRKSCTATVEKAWPWQGPNTTEELASPTSVSHEHNWATLHSFSKAIEWISKMQHRGFSTYLCGAEIIIWLIYECTEN